MRILSSQPISRILALDAWLEQNDDASIDVHEATDQMLQTLRKRSAHEDDETRLQELLSTLEHHRMEYAKRRRILQGRLPVAQAAYQTLEVAVKRTEVALQNATENLSHAEKIDELLQILRRAEVPSPADFNTVVLRLLPKRERIVKQVVQGPDLFNLRERVMREGLTTEAAAKADRPMVYHKGLQKWVPLQSAEDTDGWRD